MPSTSSTRRLSVFLVGLVVVAYAFEASGNVLFGVFVAAVCYLLAWLLVRSSGGNPLDDVTETRARVTGALVFLVLAYSVVVSAALLLGVLVATMVAVVSWLTSPVGPVARWLDRRA